MKSTPVLDFTSHGHESLLHIGGILGTGLQEWDANLVSKGLHASECEILVAPKIQVAQRYKWPKV